MRLAIKMLTRHLAATSSQQKLQEEREKRAAEDAKIKAEQDAVRFRKICSLVSFCHAALNHRL